MCFRERILSFSVRNEAMIKIHSLLDDEYGTVNV